MTATVDNMQDVIDSRDIIDRIEELDAKRLAIEEAQAELDDMRNASAEEIEEAETALQDVEDDFDDEERTELATLKTLAEEAEGYAAGWKYGETLIRESYFAEYCQELCEDIGAVPRDFPHYIEIDWESTARNIRMDYTEVDFGGVTYLIR